MTSPFSSAASSPKPTSPPSNNPASPKSSFPAPPHKTSSTLSTNASRFPSVLNCRIAKCETVIPSEARNLLFAHTLETKQIRLPPSEWNMTDSAVTTSRRLLLSARTSAAPPYASASIALSVPAALQDRLFVGEIPARAEVSAGFRAALDRAFPHPTPPAPRIPAPLHDGNRRTGTAPPANRCPQMFEQHPSPRSTVASRAIPACPSATLRPAKRTVRAKWLCAGRGYHSREPAAPLGPPAPATGSRSLTYPLRKSLAAPTCAPASRTHPVRQIPSLSSR